MKLGSKQKQELFGAVVDAFEDRNELTRMVSLWLSERLSLITSAPDLQQVAFDLIEWAEREGRSGELVAALSATKPRKEYFSSLARQLAGVAGGPSSTQATEGPTQVTRSTVDLDNLTPELRKQLYKALLAAFPTEGDLERVLKFGGMLTWTQSRLRVASTTRYWT